ncbi:MAG: tRNA pseudouridine(13) synthase TruD [Planctomycetes bacterium]|nr:tRNA pseudouridine(13) synthase TruD [Planctomycetota bacterium]
MRSSGNSLEGLTPPLLLTADLPGTGGRLRATPEDFQVEELPLYRPSGRGDHVYAWVEKRGLPTLDLVRLLARAVGCREDDVGFAGLKDADAVTRQMLSLAGVDPGRVEGVDIPGVRVLSVSRHTNKLRVGHLAGNRFRIVLRGTSAGGAERACAVVEVLARRGVPNFYGPQRFGFRGNSHLCGRWLVRRSPRAFLDEWLGGPDRTRGERAREGRAHYEAGRLEEALRALPASFAPERRALAALARGAPPGRALAAAGRRTLQLFVSAYQSHLFNGVLCRRLQDLDRLLEGDLAWLHRNGACFRVADPTAEQPRADRLELSPSGPVLGYRMAFPDGEPGRLEAEVCRAEGVCPEDFRRLGHGLDQKGARRPLRVPLRAAAVEDLGGDALALSFELPKGAYATTVMAEVMKAGAADETEDEGD